MKKALAFIIFFITNITLACVCADMGTKEAEIKKTDVIITGKILSKELFSKKDHEITGLQSSKIKYKLKVVTVHKGRIKSKILTIVSSNGGCGYDFVKGEAYIIYAYYHKEEKKDKFLYTGACTLTQKFTVREYKNLINYCKQKGSS